MSAEKQFVRFCCHCGKSIEWEKLVRALVSKAKVFFCSDLCRYADANDRRAAIKKMRSDNPNRPECPACHGRGYTRVKRHSVSRNGVSGEVSQVERGNEIVTQ